MHDFQGTEGQLSIEKGKEIPSIYRELENAYGELESAIDRFEKISALVSRLEEKNISEREFMVETLEKLIEIISEADYGSVSVLEDKKWRIIAAIGHDQEILSSLDLSKDELYIPQKVEIVDKIYEKCNMIDANREKFYKAIKPYNSTIVAPLKIDEGTIGRITLDISSNSPKKFREETRRIMDSFSKIASSFLQIRKYAKEREFFQKKLILSLVKALEYYDRYTRGHSERVAGIALSIGKAIDLPREEKEKLYWASVIHDVGKIFIPQVILNKDGKLSLDEFKQIKLHSVKGAELLEENETMNEITKIIRHHHERWDGKGYPDGLKEFEIPLLSRIITMADSYDAMTSERVYRKVLSSEEAYEEIKRCSGSQFDPELAKIFIKMKSI